MKPRMLRLACPLISVVLLGCGDSSSAPPLPASPKVAIPLPSLFEPSSAGTIRGNIRWSGELPNVPPFEIRHVVNAWNAPHARLIRENPNAPQIDIETKSIANAVVFLRKVEPRHARPWDHPAVAIEMSHRRLMVAQGNLQGNLGFVRVGDSITMVSREEKFNALQSRGAAFFTVPFPDADKPLTKILNKPGVVELSSGAGWYWMRGYLHVSDHPYLTRSGPAGDFELSEVPPGKYEIVCWLPNWNIKSQDRDSETALVTRLFFQPPLEVAREVFVSASGEAHVDFTLDAGMALPTRRK